MKKTVSIFATVVCIILSGLTFSNCYAAENEMGGDYVFFTDVTGWESALDSDTYSIYYREGNGERIYYFKCGNYYYDIHDNDYYHSPVCEDFRKNYQYIANYTYFNCNLPGREREVINGYYFYTQVKGWDNAIDYDIYSIYYREGNGERIYYFKHGNYYYDIHDNDYYHSPVCEDFRKNYQYIANYTYFNCNLSGREREVINGYHFYTQVKGWDNATDYDIYSIYYKEGNGKKVYYFKCGSSSYYEIHNNEYYNSTQCNDYRKNYKYVANYTYFNLK